MKVDVNERAQQARKYFESGYNCAQSVFLAFRDVTGLDEELAAKFSTPFGGGMGRLREVCGTVSGMSLVAGFLSPCADPSVRKAKGETYALSDEYTRGNDVSISIVNPALMKNKGR